MFVLRSDFLKFVFSNKCCHITTNHKILFHIFQLWFVWSGKIWPPRARVESRPFIESAPVMLWLTATWANQSAWKRDSFFSLFPMEESRKGGPQEAHLVEWPLKQQSAVNMLWCHAPRADADRPSLSTRPLAPVLLLRGALRTRRAADPKRESVTGMWTVMDSCWSLIARVAWRWTACASAAQNPTGSAVRGGAAERAIKRVKIVMGLCGRTWSSHCNARSAQVRRVFAWRESERPTWDSASHLGAHAWNNAGNVRAMDSVIGGGALWSVETQCLLDHLRPALIGPRDGEANPPGWKAPPSEIAPLETLHAKLIFIPTTSCFFHLKGKKFK